MVLVFIILNDQGDRAHTKNSLLIERFISHGQDLWKLLGTKIIVYIRLQDSLGTPTCMVATSLPWSPKRLPWRHVQMLYSLLSHSYNTPCLPLLLPPPPAPPKIVSISIVSSFSWDLQSSQENLKTIFIRHLHIPHNAHYLTPKISHSLCFSFLLDITAVPREIENNAYARFWGANKVYYGGCASGKCNIFGGKQGVLWLMWK